ncbi:hypothetical protein DY245_28410 [Streptomyces inhibens]|uniref:Uncharacterized protein n=1 Tax=Streptomyces inhibens TaxID=2293571 RepID=A0A371PXE2_STRIH|nr:hypothetical protein [Streptomyces inhibens]REK87128.1 hypothetical protein DY245_28410 [Streptomyces inhibens]
MCISMDRAEFSGTTLYGGRLRHPVHGLVHVLGYQNSAVNLADGPNAMLLHLPTASRMTREHFIPVGRTGDVLHRMVDAVRPVPVGVPDDIAWMGGEDSPVEVFEHDIYTVLLAADPTRIPAALGDVPRHKRPRLDPDLLTFYAERYPAHTIAVCCFDNAEAQHAKPLLMWYSPLDPDRLTLPALDCHTGKAPDLDAEVAVDHWVLLSTDEAPLGWGEPVDYPRGMRHHLRTFLPETVVGAYYGGRLANGDFSVTHDDLLAGDLDRMRRIRPMDE